jgi:2EXR family
MALLSRTQRRPVIILYDKETNAALANRLVLPPPQSRDSLSNPPSPSASDAPAEPRSRLPWKRISQRKPVESHKRIKPITQTCSLFMRLPAEIRAMIYEFALADYPAVHILHFHQRLAHVQCQHPSGPTLHHVIDAPRQVSERCCMRGLIATRNPLATSIIAKHRQGFTALRDKLSSGNITLLQTCRQAYIEGIGILYSKNTFDFANPETARAFLMSLVPNRLQSIRALSVSFESTSNLSGEITRSTLAWWDVATYWEPLWKLVQENLTSLRRVRIFVCALDMQKDENQTVVMRPLENLKELDEFEVDFRIPKPSSQDAKVELCDQVRIWRDNAMKGARRHQS